MSTTTSLNDVAALVKGHLSPDQYQRFCVAITHVDAALEDALKLINSASQEGCESDLAVIDADCMNQLSHSLFQARRAVTGSGTITIDLTCQDDLGNEADGATAELTIQGISEIVDHASQVVLNRRDGKSYELALSRLEDALVAHDVVSQAPQSPTSGLDMSDCRDVQIEVEDGVLLWDEATFPGSDEPALLNPKLLANAAVIAYATEYPNADEYGTPDTASQQGAEVLVRQLGLIPTDMTLSAVDRGDDGMGSIHIVVRLPVSGVIAASVDELKAFALEQSGAIYDQLSDADKQARIEQYIEHIMATIYE